ncbi:DNA translocase FtsK (plasmid) [Haladaptatus sp. SPP-AMP-3]|uniref:DNA translocase FtsK n=1 Tax=Haladaptatus sp. SPP-AMP-3 TaxID=3121295 RepID=UPI003C2F4ED8
MSESTQTQDSSYKSNEALIGEAIANETVEQLTEENIGVIIESPPRFDDETFIDNLCSNIRYNVGLAMVNIDEANIGDLQSRTEDSSVRLTEKVSDAVNWRNGTDTGFEWDGYIEPEKIVILVRGDHARLNSMKDFEGMVDLPLAKITREITDLMQAKDQFADSPPGQAIWETLGSDLYDRFEIPAVADYATSTLQQSEQASLDALGTQLYRLRLFNDPGLNNPDEIPERLSDNLDLVLRVSHMSNRDRRRLTNSVTKVEDNERKEREKSVAKLRRFERTGNSDILADLTYKEVEDIFSTSGQSSQRRSTTSTRKDVESASVEAVFDDKDEELERLSEEFDDQYREAVEEEENRVDMEFSGDEQLAFEVNDNLYYFVEHFVTKDSFGGIIYDPEDRQSAVKNFQALRTEKFQPREEDSSFEKLRKVAENSGKFEDLVDSIDGYVTARSELVDALPGLLSAPLIRLLGDEDLLDSAEEYIEAYREVQDKLDKKYREIQNVSSEGSSKLLSDFLLFDSIILEYEDDRELIVSPLHPLHLWKYSKLAREMKDEKESLTEEERDFLINSVEEQPHVLRSIHVGGNYRLADETYLVQSDEIGRLPVYTRIENAAEGTNSKFYDYVLNKFTSAYPPSRRQLKISVVDPLDPVDLLSDIANLAEKDVIHGATVEFAFIENEEKPVLNGTTSPSVSEDIINLFGPDNDSGRFEIFTTKHASYDSYAEDLESDPQHFILINDQSDFSIQTFERDAETTIHPLYVPKEFDYDLLEDKINISPSKEGVLFSEYQDLINQLYNQRQAIHNAEVNELNIEKETIDKLLDSAIWASISSPSMNGNPFWKDNLISKERRGERDFATYSEDIDYFRRVLRRIINEYRLAPNDTDLEEIAERIADLQQSGLLRLITRETLGGGKSRNTKGLLGSIIAVQWLQQTLVDPKLIFSIDNPRTREWLNLGDSESRADILTVQFDNDGGLILDIIEIKTLEEISSAYTVKDEDGTKIVEGSAVDQVFETTDTIRGLFTGDKNLTTSPRKEALREQLYYELTSSEGMKSKQEWADRINDVFKGEEQLEINPRIVSVEVTSEATSEERIDGVTPNAQSIRVDKLPRQSIKRLIVSGIEDREDQHPEQETGGKDEDESDKTELEADKEETGEEEEEIVVESKQIDVDTGSSERFGDPEEYTDQVETLKRVLNDFKINIRDIDPSNIDVGPNVIRFKIRLAPGERQNSLEQRTEDIAREMAFEKEPIVQRLPGTEYIALDVPRENNVVVPLRDYRDRYKPPSEIEISALPFLAGVTPDGDVYRSDLSDAPHMLVGGATGGGKTVFLYSLIMNFMEQKGEGNVEFALVDPKETDFIFFDALPNLSNDEVITDAEDAANLFEWLVDEEIPRRKQLFRESVCRDIGEYNEQNPDEQMKPIVVIIDEYSDLLQQLGEDADDTEDNVRRIAQIARAQGIHLVISTQRPSHEAIDTDLRANLDTRVAFRLPKHSDSRILIDEGGAEELGGDGDMLLKEADRTTRLQGLYVDSDDIRELINQYR